MFEASSGGSDNLTGYLSSFVPLITRGVHVKYQWLSLSTSATHDRPANVDRDSLGDRVGGIPCTHLFGGRGFFTEPRLEFDPALVNNHTITVTYPTALGVGHFKMRIHTVGLINHTGKLSKAAKHCKAGLDMRDLGTAPLYWISTVPLEITLQAIIDPTSNADVFRAIIPHFNATEEAEIRKGMTGHILVSFSLESTNKAYYAVLRPYPIQLGATDSQAGGNFVHVVVSEAESDVVSSQPLLLWVEGWEKSALANIGKPRKLSKKETRAVLSQIPSKEAKSS